MPKFLIALKPILICSSSITVKFTKLWAEKEGVFRNRFSLTAALEFAEVPITPGAHQSKIDAQNTYKLWKKGMEAGADHLSSIIREPHIIKTG